MPVKAKLLAAGLFLLPGLAFAQTAVPPAPDAPPAVAAPAPATAPDNARPVHRHHDRAERREHRAEMHARYRQLGPDDKARFDALSQQIHELRHQQMTILGLRRS